MEFSYEFAHSAEEIFEKITDVQFIADRCIALGSLDADCGSDEKALPNITITRTEEAELPALMKKVVGKQQEMKTIEQWSETDESYDSRSMTTVAGTPIKIAATQCLYNTEEGSQITVELTVTAKIPLLRSKVEPMIASKVRKEMLREFEYTEQHC